MSDHLQIDNLQNEQPETITVPRFRQTITSEAIDPETGEINHNSTMPKWMDEEIEIQKRQRFIRGTCYDKRVRKSLALFNNSDEYGISLLQFDNQKTYASEADYIFQKKLRNLRRNAIANSSKFGKIDNKHYPTDDHSIAKERLRWGTIIHAVTALNKDDALDAAYELKEVFTKCVKQCRGLSCYAVLEAEIVSYRNMLKNKDHQANNCNDDDDLYNEKQHIKLINTKLLGDHLGDAVLNGEDGLVSIHLHVLLVAKNSSVFDKFKTILESTNLWNSGLRQIKIDGFRKVFKDKDKPVLLSLNHMALYLSKGGTDIDDKYPTLKYKIDAPNDKLTSYDEYFISRSLYDNNGISDVPHDHNINAQHYSSDFLSLSPLEINTLHEINEGMMNFDESRTGHIIKLGHW